MLEYREVKEFWERLAGQIRREALSLEGQTAPDPREGRFYVWPSAQWCVGYSRDHSGHRGEKEKVYALRWKVPLTEGRGVGRFAIRIWQVRS